MVCPCLRNPAQEARTNREKQKGEKLVIHDCTPRKARPTCADLGDPKKPGADPGFPLNSPK